MKMGETAAAAAAGGGRSKFPAFPYEPYPIQLDFMNALYDALDRGGVAMLESPTGIPVSSSSPSCRCLIVILWSISLFRNWEDTQHDLQCASVGGGSKA